MSEAVRGMMSYCFIEAEGEGVRAGEEGLGMVVCTRVSDYAAVRCHFVVKPVALRMLNSQNSMDALRLAATSFGAVVGTMCDGIVWLTRARSRARARGRRPGTANADFRPLPANTAIGAGARLVFDSEHLHLDVTLLTFAAGG
jgi:hypothetical protein